MHTRNRYLTTTGWPWDADPGLDEGFCLDDPPGVELNIDLGLVAAFWNEEGRTAVELLTGSAYILDVPYEDFAAMMKGWRQSARWMWIAGGN